MPWDGDQHRHPPEDGRPLFASTPRLFKGAAKGVHHGAWHLRRLEFALPFFEREMRSQVHAPGRRLWSLRRGFLSESWVLFGLDRNDWRRYLTDYERSVGTRLVNGPYGVLLDDKLLFDRLLRAETIRLPALEGVLQAGRVEPETPVRGTSPDLAAFLADRTGTFVVKPVVGGGGKDVFILSCDGDGNYLCNGNRVGAETIGRLALRQEGSVVTGFVHQHDDIAAVFPDATNTIRILTMTDAAGAPFVAAAVARFGTVQSQPTDNWIRGGICAAVDVASGCLGPGAVYPAYHTELEWTERHPDTGHPIEGLLLPNWTVAVSELLALARRLPWLNQIGWDIVITGDGFRIIEGNSYSGTNLFQIHAPLLDDPRVRAFYRRHGVFSRKRRRMLDLLWRDT